MTSANSLGSEVSADGGLSPRFILCQARTMYPVQPLVDDLIALLQKYPDVTPTQIMILKSAAAYLTLDDDDGRGIDRKQEDWDPRLLLTRTDWELVPDRIELI